MELFIEKYIWIKRLKVQVNKGTVEYQLASELNFLPSQPSFQNAISLMNCLLG